MLSINSKVNLWTDQSDVRMTALIVEIANLFLPKATLSHKAVDALYSTL
jgi:hypothetical protein